MIWHDKRDGTEHFLNLKGELIRLVTPADVPTPVRGFDEQNS